MSLVACLGALPRGLWAGGAVVDMDFANDRYVIGGQVYYGDQVYRSPGLSVSTPAGYVETAAGVLVPTTAGTFRRSDKGLLVEEGRTNLFLNSFAPATQTITITAASHTITVWGGGSVTVAAGTATISNGGAVTAGSPRTIGCTVTGTITVTVTGSPTAVQVEAGTRGTSPISTAGATAARAADASTVAYTWPGQGTIYASWIYNSTDGRAVWLDNSTNPSEYTNGFAITPRSGNGARTSIFVAGAATDINSGNTATGGVARAASSLSASNVRGALNGVQAFPPAAGGSPVGIDKLRLGWHRDGLYLNSYLQRIRIFPTAMNDAELQALTA